MKNNQLQLVTDEQAQKLNDLGMDTDVSCYVHKENIEWETRKFKPTIQQAFLWLRNEKGIEIEIRPDFEMNEDKTFYMSYTAYYWQNYTEKRLDIGGIHCNKELAEQLALNKALELLPL